MKTQKNNILPTMPADEKARPQYDREMQKKIMEMIRDIATDIEELDARVTALEP